MCLVMAEQHEKCMNYEQALLGGGGCSRHLMRGSTEFSGRAFFQGVKKRCAELVWDVLVPNGTFTYCLLTSLWDDCW